MKYIAAYMLAKLGGKEEPTFEDIKRIIESVGIEIDEDKINQIINKLKGRNINEVITEGTSKLSIISNEQATQQNHNQYINEQNDEQNNQEEEEALELGLGNVFEDLFN